MSSNKIIAALFGVALMALTACSSSFGGGSPPPEQVRVVVPPNSNVSSPQQ